MTARGRWVLLLGPVLVVGLVFAAEQWFDGQENRSLQAEDLPRPGYGPRDYGAALALVEGQVAGWRESLAIGPDDWLPQAGLAQSLAEQARLTGDFAVLAEAQAAMARATALAPDGAGPTLAAAHTALAAHRLDLAEDALVLMRRSVVPDGPDEQAEGVALAGDIAFYRGQMGEAERLYAQAQALSPGPGGAYRQAALAKARGDLDEASAMFASALGAGGKASPETVANIALQLGAIEQARGRYGAALGWFRRADALFAGHWLIEAQLAQAEYLTGARGAAMARLEGVLARSQPAEVMELYALLLLREGEEAQSKEWSARAAAIWEERLGALPIAAYGHAIEHHLRFGTPARALELAQRNAAARPYGEARLLLAEALLANHRPAEALAGAWAARAAGWRSAPLLAVEAAALTAQGKSTAAQRVRAEAEAINPLVFDPLAELVWFGHG